MVRHPYGPYAARSQCQRRNDHRGGHDPLRSRAVQPESYHVVSRRTAVVRPGAQLGVRIQPWRGDQVLPEGAEARPGVRHGALGRELRLGAELQFALASLRPARPADGPVGRLRRDAGRARARRQGQSRRAGDDPSAARALSPARGDRGHGAVGQGLHQRDAQGVRSPPRRSRGARRLCRSRS